MADGGCWTASATPAGDPSCGPGRWYGPTAPCNVDMHQWQGNSLSCPSSAPAPTSRIVTQYFKQTLTEYGSLPSVGINGQQQGFAQNGPIRQVANDHAGTSPPVPPPRYDAGMTSSRNEESIVSGGTAGGGATVSVSIVHNLDASGLYNQAKGEIKLTFSSTLSSAPIASNGGHQNHGPHQVTVESTASTGDSSAVPLDPAAAAATVKTNVALHHQHHQGASEPRPRSGNSNNNNNNNKHNSECAAVHIGGSAQSTTSMSGIVTAGSTTAVTTTSTRSSSICSGSVGLLTEADEVISEFLGQINAEFSNSSPAAAAAAAVDSAASRQVPTSVSSLHHLTGTAGVSAPVPMSESSARYPFPYFNSAAMSGDPTAVKSAYGKVPPANFKQEVLNNGSANVFQPPQIQKGTPSPFDSNFIGGTGGGGGGGGFMGPMPHMDIATGPAAETLKKMAAMHRSLYERADSTPSATAACPQPWMMTPSTADDQSYPFPVAAGYAVRRTASTSSAVSYMSSGCSTNAEYQQLPYANSTYGDAAAAAATAGRRAFPGPGPLFNRGDSGTGSMRSLSHYPDVGNGPTSNGIRSQRFARQHGVMRMSQSQYVSVQQQQQQSVGGNVGNGINHIEATQSQSIQIGFADGSNSGHQIGPHTSSLMRAGTVPVLRRRTSAGAAPSTAEVAAQLQQQQHSQHHHQQQRRPVSPSCSAAAPVHQISHQPPQQQLASAWNSGDAVAVPDRYVSQRCQPLPPSVPGIDSVSKPTIADTRWPTNAPPYNGTSATSGGSRPMMSNIRLANGSYPYQAGNHYGCGTGAAPDVNSLKVNGHPSIALSHRPDSIPHRRDGGLRPEAVTAAPGLQTQRSGVDPNQHNFYHHQQQQQHYSFHVQQQQSVSFVVGGGANSPAFPVQTPNNAMSSPPSYAAHQQNQQSMGPLPPHQMVEAYPSGGWEAPTNDDFTPGFHDGRRPNTLPPAAAFPMPIYGGRAVNGQPPFEGEMEFDVTGVCSNVSGADFLVPDGYGVHHHQFAGSSSSAATVGASSADMSLFDEIFGNR